MLKSLLTAFVLSCVSYFVISVTVALAPRFVPEGGGIAEARAITPHNLFRFDSLYYYGIATTGYSYNGDPNSSPNLVFAPLFPLLTRVVAIVCDAVTAGFILNELLLFLALWALSIVLSEWLGEWRARGMLLAMVTAAGSYAFHAYYSESTMLACLALCLLSFQRQWWWRLAFASAALGASRLTGAPLAGVFAMLFVFQAFRLRRDVKAVVSRLAMAAICVSGALAYLIYVSVYFGNPLTLFPEIQASSWGLFHQPASFASLISFNYLADYWVHAFDRGFHLDDIKTLNLVWMSLGAFSCIYMLLVYRRNIMSLLFLVYFLFVYANDASSEFLISAHRFFVLMLPIFIMGSALHGVVRAKAGWAAAYVVSGVLLLVNISFGILHAAYFNQGVWYFF